MFDIEALGFLLAIVAAIAALTTILSLLVGRRLARRSRVLAVILCGLAAPAALAVVANLQYAMTRNDPGDMAPMAYGSLLIIAMLSVPIGLLTALIALRRR